MTDKKISELPAAGALTGTELVPIVQAGNTDRTTTQAIADLAAAGGSPAILVESGSETKISALPAGVNPDGSEPVPAVQAGATVALEVYQFVLRADGAGSGDAGGSIDITAGNGNVAGNSHGGNVSVTAGDGHGSSNSGSIDLTCGTADGTGLGGALTLSSGDAAGTQGAHIGMSGGAPGANDNGAIITLTASNGHGSGAGGYLAVRAGAGGSTGDGGHIEITGGASGGGATGSGGDIDITSGVSFATDGDGGDITLTPQAGAGIGRHGLIILANLPILDPGVSGALWNNAGTLKISP